MKVRNSWNGPQIFQNYPQEPSVIKFLWSINIHVLWVWSFDNLLVGDNREKSNVAKSWLFGREMFAESRWLSLCISNLKLGNYSFVILKWKSQDFRKMCRKIKSFHFNNLFRALVWSTRAQIDEKTRLFAESTFDTQHGAVKGRRHYFYWFFQCFESYGSKSFGVRVIFNEEHDAQVRKLLSLLVLVV